MGTTARMEELRHIEATANLPVNMVLALTKLAFAILGIMEDYAIIVSFIIYHEVTGTDHLIFFSDYLRHGLFEL